MATYRLKVNGDGLNGYVRLKVNVQFKAQGKWLLMAHSKWLFKLKVNGDGVNGTPHTHTHTHTCLSYL